MIMKDGIWLTPKMMVMILMRMIKCQSSVVMGARSRWPRYAATTTVRVPTTHEPTPPHPTFGLASLGFGSRWCSFRGFNCNPNVTFALISLLWALTQVAASNFVVKGEETRVDNSLIFHIQSCVLGILTFDLCWLVTRHCVFSLIIQWDWHLTNKLLARRLWGFIPSCKREVALIHLRQVGLESHKVVK